MKTESVTVNGIEMDYFCFGKGERAFVILPGVDTKSILRSAKAIENAYRDFEEDYTVYVFDRRRNMPPGYTVRQMGEDTAAVMQHIGLCNADIFGASQGGMIAMCIAAFHPELVHKLALGSTAARVDESVTAGTARWIALAEAGDMVALTAEFIDNLYSEATIGKYRELLLHMNDNVTERELERFIIQTRAIDGFDLTAELNQITCPTLVIGVEGDRVLPCRLSREIAEAVGCELYLYGSEYGHCAFDEAPDYKQRLLNFFHK